MRLIDADALFEFAKTEEGVEILDHSVFKVLLLRRILDKAPTIEAEPVRHGEANPHIVQYIASGGALVAEYQEGWECPFCCEIGVKNYCPNCGAKMDGGEKE